LLFPCRPDFYEQSTEEIWAAACECVKGALVASPAEAANVAGVGFDATCSLALVGESGEGVLLNTPSATSSPFPADVVMWMDHRANEQAERINSLGHDVLRFVGGSISPEMQVPKLLWLAERQRDVFDLVKHFLDLSDWMIFRAVGDNDQVVIMFSE